MAFPVTRLRRLRRTPQLRDLVRETRLHPSDFILPLFIEEGRTAPVAIGSMPGVRRHSMASLVREAEIAKRAGVPGVILFGIPKHKDPLAKSGYAKNGVVQQAVRRLKKEIPELVVLTDVCACEYTSHGHCGILKGQEVQNDPTLALLEKIALSHAEAGVDLVAPSDMMDGRVGAIRRALDTHGFQDLPILAYSAKFASAFYGPFREAVDSTPAFGDRKSYQMDAANPREAIREIEQDLAEGADLVMVKPALTALDVITRAKERFKVPVWAYHVSGEYAMIEAARQKGWLDGDRAQAEALTAIKRAGADRILTYWAVQAAKWFK